MKILITHVPAGSGHEKAAEAVSVALRRTAPQAQVRMLDALEGADAHYRWCFTRGYLGVIDRMPWLWGLGFSAADWRPIRGLSARIHRWSNAAHGRKLEGILLEQQPDVIVGAHFFPMEVAGYLKSTGRLQARLITVITDFFPHGVWIAPGIDIYSVASDETRAELVRRGVPAERIQVVGTPIEPKFAQPLDRKSVAAKLGLDPDRFTVLICSGGYGIGRIAEVVRAVARLPDPMQILVVAGKNAHLLQELKALGPRPPHQLKLFGFVDNMHELMTASDLFLSKPGGLSCVEALAKGLPMILLDPIPGQEAYNAQWITQMGVAVQTARISDVPRWVARLRGDPDLRMKMAESARRNGCPDAATAVARLALG